MSDRSIIVDADDLSWTLVVEGGTIVVLCDEIRWDVLYRAHCAGAVQSGPLPDGSGYMIHVTLWHPHWLDHPAEAAEWLQDVLETDEHIHPQPLVDPDPDRWTCGVAPDLYAARQVH